MIVRRPTFKSRAAALSSLSCVILIYLLEGWIYPAMPPYILLVIGSISIALLFLARTIREQDGKKLEIRDELKNKIAKFSILEASFSLISGILVVFCIVFIQMGVVKNLQRLMFIGSASLFILTGFISYWALSNINKIIRDESI
jgi:hypothetical protein